MLTSLIVKDYALIENIEVAFGKGLNIITGETGAGKSILIDAMSLLLGERASTEAVRKGAIKSIVEGVFEIKNNPKVELLLQQNEIESQSEIIVRREISLKGSNRCFINDTPVQLSVIKEIGKLLVDLHGQHEHQSLLDVDTHIELLDEFGNLTELLNEFSVERKKLNKLYSELNELIEKENSLKEKKEFYEFQIKEIDAVEPKENEDEEISNELKVLENAEETLELTNKLYKALYDDEDSAYDKLMKAKNVISSLTKIDRKVAEKESDFNSTLASLFEIAEYFRNYRDNIDLEPEHLEELRERLSAINMLKKKYGGTLKLVLEHRERIGKEYDLAENFAEKIKELENKLLVVRTKCGDIAKEISQRRSEIAQNLKTEIEKSLSYLGIEDARFETTIKQVEITDNKTNYIIADEKKYKFNSRGFDEVEFLISTNIGEDPKPLTKVASGGEVSRIMLALKSILAKNDKLPILIFDEIDVGISGRIAQKVGQTLKSLASFHQIIAITHLPQIASLADAHYAVSKGKSGDRMVSNIQKLSKQESIKEVAKLLSGEEVTEASLKSAKELMGG